MDIPFIAVSKYKESIERLQSYIASLYERKTNGAGKQISGAETKVYTVDDFYVLGGYHESKFDNCMEYWCAYDDNAKVLNDTVYFEKFIDITTLRTFVSVPGNISTILKDRIREADLAQYCLSVTHLSKKLTVIITQYLNKQHSTELEEHIHWAALANKDEQ